MPNLFSPLLISANAEGERCRITHEKTASVERCRVISFFFLFWFMMINLIIHMFNAALPFRSLLLVGSGTTTTNLTNFVYN